MSTSWFVYILECSDHSFYTGIAKDIEKRVRKHNNGQGAKYTYTRRPVEVVFFEQFDTHSEAARREIEIKKWNRSKKQDLILRKDKVAPRFIRGELLRNSAE